MSVNLNNYEIYFIDFFDGNLTAEGENELMLFLESKPELKKEFEYFENINLNVEEIVFSDKLLIKKPEIKAFASINEENYENNFIAFYEGDLNKNEKSELEQFLELNPFLKQEFEIHNKLKLPRQDMVFEDKDQLKKRIIMVSWQFRVAATAASIALLMSVFWFLNENAGFDKSELLGISAVEPRNISLKNIGSIEIEEREIRLSVSEGELIAQTEFAAEQIKTERKNIEETNSITYLKVYGEEIALTGEIQCAKLMTYENSYETYWDLANTVEKQNGLLAKVFNNNANKLINAIKPNDSQFIKSNEKDPVFVKFLAGSVNIFNTITGSEVEQLKVYDGEGNLKNYQIETEMLTLNKNISSPGLP